MTSKVGKSIVLSERELAGIATGHVSQIRRPVFELAGYCGVVDPLDELPVMTTRRGKTAAKWSEQSAVDDSTDFFAVAPMQAEEVVWVREALIAVPNHEHSQSPHTESRDWVYALDRKRIPQRHEATMFWSLRSRIAARCMPKWASRFSIKIESVKLQMLCQAHAEDAEREGIWPEETSYGLLYKHRSLERVTGLAELALTWSWGQEADSELHFWVYRVAVVSKAVTG